MEVTIPAELYPYHCSVRHTLVITERGTVASLMDVERILLGTDEEV